MAKNGLETVRELTQMRRDLSEVALQELRGGNKPDPRSRIEKIRAAYPLEYEQGVFSNRGNTSYYVFDESGKKDDRFASGISIQYIGTRDVDRTCVAIYPFGIIGTTEAGQPIFDDSPLVNRVAIAMEYGDDDYRTPFLKKRIQPLFNVDKDGNVFSRISDQPTPKELELLCEILDQFEAVTLAS